MREHTTRGGVTSRPIGPIDPYLFRSQSSKQTKLTATSLKHWGAKLKKSIAKFFVYNHIPSHVVESPYFKNMIDTSGEAGPGIKTPSAYELAGPLLDDEVTEVEQYVKSFERVWDERGCTIMCDGWTGPTKKSLINFLVYSDSGTVFLKSVDASNKTKDAEYLFGLMDEMVEQVGESRVVQIVTDNAANYKAAGKLLMEKRRHLYWTPCAAHCVDLILEDLGKQKEADSVIGKARAVTSFIYNSDKLVNLLRSYPDQGELLRPAITRFATQFVALESLRKYKENLKMLVSSPEWAAYEKFIPKSRRAACTKVSNTIYSSLFWKDIDDWLNVALPLVQVLKMVDGDDKPTMGYVYESMDKAKLAIQKSCGRNYKSYWKIIDKRWDDQFHHYLHAAGNLFITFIDLC
eukprot:TRINITY_DN1151_c0_g1_i1.p1 TRINITY_DN1151_c0_g1~~TRINITY_DN1151_c0_g1_i1.p1  ORF type:complete len:405 (-),score=41.67 TRINITY_DN1151_c0_g1_i1:1916-3130(-)